MSPTRRPSVFAAASDRLVFSHARMIMKTPLIQRAFSLVTAKTTELRRPRRIQRRQEDAPRRRPECPKYCNRCCQNCCQLQHYLQHSSIRVVSQPEEGAKGEAPGALCKLAGDSWCWSWLLVGATAAWCRSPRRPLAGRCQPRRRGRRSRGRRRACRCRPCHRACRRRTRHEARRCRPCP
jgi:hypothetical protein